MHLPGLASFRFSSRGDEIAATVTSAAREELILDAYRRRVLPMALQVCGREVMHASAVRSPAGYSAMRRFRDGKIHHCFWTEWPRLSALGR